jgi:hypothetical protein
LSCGDANKCAQCSNGFQLSSSNNSTSCLQCTIANCM